MITWRFFLQLVCGKCSSKRAPLAYLDNRKERVCTECYAMIRPLSPVVCDVPPTPTYKLQQRKALQVTVLSSVLTSAV